MAIKNKKTISKTAKKTTKAKSEVKKKIAKKAVKTTKKVDSKKKSPTKTATKPTKKAVKKTATKKQASTAKKVTKKVAAKKVVKKPVKKTAQKIVKKTTSKKTTPKKTAKKTTSKTTKKVAKKTAPKSVKKIAPKKASKPVKSAKKATPKKIEKPTKKTAPKQKNETKKLSEKKTIKTESQDNIIELKSKIEVSKKTNFKINDYVVYPSHGIGKIIDVEKTVVLGQDFSCYLMFFEKEKLTIKVPIQNSEKIGLRKLVTKNEMDEVFSILRSGMKKMKGMWSRRAQEYEAKINSGDIVALAEVLRDLARDIEDGERSYSERIIYETAVARLAAEYGAIHKITFEEAKEAVIATAKDKLGGEEKSESKKHIDKDDFDDEFDDIEDEEDEYEDDDDYDDDDDSEPRKHG